MIQPQIRCERKMRLKSRWKHEHKKREKQMQSICHLRFAAHSFVCLHWLINTEKYYAQIGVGDLMNIDIPSKSK